MKKTLSVLALLGIVTCSAPSAEAFCWSMLNPANWGHCKCEKKCDPCETGYAAPCEKKKLKKCDPCKVQQQVEPCDPCEKVKKECDPCDKLQNMNK